MLLTAENIEVVGSVGNKIKNLFGKCNIDGIRIRFGGRTNNGQIMDK